MKTNGGTVLARSLSALGVTEAFVLHGGHLDAFLVACKDVSVSLTDTRHEATAGFAATAFSRATGGLGVCVVTAGPGFTNALTAIADAYLDAAPVLFITSAPPLREVETNPLQGGIDQIRMAAPVTKWAHRVTHVERIPDLVDKAVRIALTGRPGPVLLELPIDVIFAPVDDEHLTLPQPVVATRPAPPAAAVDRALELLAGAQRPALVVGGGAAYSPGCPEQVAAFAERTGIPVIYGAKANGILPVDHPSNLGTVGTLGAAGAAGQPPDVVLLLGARSGMTMGGRSGAILPHDVTLIHVDVDGVELGRITTPTLAVVADAGEMMAALNAGLSRRPVEVPSAWVQTLRECRAAVLSRFDDAPETTATGLLHPHAATTAAVQALSPDTAIVYDGGETPSWLLPQGRSPGVGLLTGNGYLGPLGVGLGFAIGLAKARPGSPVAVFTGDGAAGFHIADLDTMARHSLPITTIIINNASWGISRHGQELVFGRDSFAAVELERRDYHVVAEGLGCRGVLITSVEQIAPALQEAQASGRPTCLNVMTDPEVMHPNVEKAVGFTDNEDEIPIPYYENIPIRR